MTVSILHLTDIHAGPGELNYEDKKAHIDGADRQKRLPRLAAYLQALPYVPDFVVVSGDITIRDDATGLEQFRGWLFSQIQAGALPDAKRIIVSPTTTMSSDNHDAASGSVNDLALSGTCFAKRFLMRTFHTGILS